VINCIALHCIAGPGCVVTLEAYKSIHGKEPDTSGGDVGSLFGWTENDGLEQNFPTDDSEKVFYQDLVSTFDEVHVNACYSWYVHVSTTDTESETHKVAKIPTDNCGKFTHAQTVVTILTLVNIVYSSSPAVYVFVPAMCKV